MFPVGWWKLRMSQGLYWTLQNWQHKIWHTGCLLRTCSTSNKYSDWKRSGTVIWWSGQYDRNEEWGFNANFEESTISLSDPLLCPCIEPLYGKGASFFENAMATSLKVSFLIKKSSKRDAMLEKQKQRSLQNIQGSVLFVLLAGRYYKQAHCKVLSTTGRHCKKFCKSHWKLPILLFEKTRRFIGPIRK